MFLVENFYPSHDLLVLVLVIKLLSYQTREIEIFWNLLSILRKKFHAKEQNNAHSCVFNDDNHHCS
jgi:hypothetical protein